MFPKPEKQEGVAITRQQRDAGGNDCEYIYLYLFTTSKDGGLDPAQELLGEVSREVGAWASRRGVPASASQLVHCGIVLSVWDACFINTCKGFAGRKQLRSRKLEGNPVDWS